MNPHGNAANLDPKYLQQLEALGEAAKQRFLYGQFAEDSEGSLWTEETLAQNRVLGQEGQKLPQWLRVVVAVDPSGTKGHARSWPMPTSGTWLIESSAR